MIDDAFVTNFMATNPTGAATSGLPDNVTYTKAEVDEIVQQAVHDTVEAFKTSLTNMAETDSEPESEKEENTDGGENNENSGDSSGEEL